MRNDPFDGLVSTRKSAIYYIDAITDEAIHQRFQIRRPHGMNQQAFFDDACNFYSLQRDRTLGLSTDSEATETLVANAFPSRYGGPPRDFAEAAWWFIEGAAQELLTGRTWFEIEYLYDPGDANSPTAFRIHSLVPGSVDTEGSIAIQYVPRGLQADAFQSKEGAEAVRLDGALLVSADLPPSWREKCQRALDVLAAAEPLQFAESRLITVGGFDPDEFNYAQQRVVLREMRDVGWSGRSFFAGGLLEPYILHRQLDFARFKIQIRDTALAAIDECLAKVGSTMGFSATIDRTRLRTEGDLEEARERLRLGTIPFEELWALGQ